MEEEMEKEGPVEKELEEKLVERKDPVKLNNRFKYSSLLVILRSYFEYWERKQKVL